MASADKKEPEAVVSKIVTARGRRYVVTYLRQPHGRISTKMAITFSLSGWDDDSEPEPGQLVKLTGIREFVKGWRAEKASPVVA